ncbi:ABC transporter substrate-binding protein [Novipirellula sp.]|uniref:ABC transporter substrate-binding protein n=1 Tax=Novipirellula sp. TaxID=2795430 RepID=UPI00356A766C
MLTPICRAIRFGYGWLAMIVFASSLQITTGKLHGEETEAGERKFHVAMFTPRDQDDAFWGPFVEFMGEVSDDLGIQLEVFFAGNSRNRMVSQIRDVCDREDKPDAIVFQSFKRGGPRFLRIAERRQVPAVLVNAGLQPEQSEELGQPRTKLTHWLAEVLPDDYDAGFQLANALIDEALRSPRRLAADGKLHVIGLSGVVSDGASIQRMAGLHDAIAKRSDEVVLDQVVAADWSQELARFRCRILHRRYPESSVIWSASDAMAIGAIAAMQDRGKTPGTDVIIGGVDATPEALGLIAQEVLFASVGGHVMEGGWCIVLLHDFFHGIDLSRIPTHYDSPMRLITRDNLAAYRAVLSRETWQETDFRQFSLLDRPNQSTYRFDLGRVAAGAGLENSLGIEHTTGTKRKLGPGQDDRSRVNTGSENDSVVPVETELPETHRDGESR